MIIKNQKINCLLIALTAALCLSACASGTSSSPTPTPTPSPSPTPTPVAGESGVYAITPFSLSMSFATQPSTDNWVNFTSGTTNSIAGLATTESTLFVLDRPAVTAADTTSQYNIYGGTQIQIITANTSLPVTITGGATADGLLPQISATQIATNGNGAVVAAPSTVDNAYSITAYTLYSIAANGTPTAITNYVNTSGNNTALAPVSTQPLVAFINGMYYAYDVVAGSVLYSQNGTTWQQALITGGAGSGINNVVQVSGSVFALQAGTNVYLGSGPFTFGATAATTLGAANDTIMANSTGKLYIYDAAAYPSELALYTPSSVSLGAAVAVSNGFATPQQLVLAGTNVYLLSTAGQLYFFPVNGSVISAPVIAQTTTNTTPTYLQAPPAFGGFIAPMGSQVLMVNNQNTYADYNTGDLASVTNNGSISAVSAVNPTSGVATFTNLATGMNLSNDSLVNPIPSRQTLVTGFAGTQTNYMMVLTNGAVLVSSANGFVEAAPILHPWDGTTGEGMPADVDQLVSTNGTYLAADNGSSSSGGGNLYFSDNNGTSWTDIPAASLPVSSNSGTTITTQNGYYYIIFDGEGKTYQTATPQNLASWVQVSNIPLVTNSTKINKQAQAKSLNSHQLNTFFIGSPYKYYNGTYYEFYGDTSLGVYNQTTGETTVTNNILPQDTDYRNIAYNGTTFAIAQTNASYIWTSSSLTSGPASWTQNVATFTGINNSTMNIGHGVDAFLWTGKIWILGNSLPTGILPSGYVFSSNNLTTWNAAAYTTPTSTQAYVNGIPKLF